MLYPVLPVFGARLLDRLGAGTRSAPRDALIASSVDEKDRGRAFGLEGFGDNAGAFLGPLLAVFLLYVLHVGIRAIFYMAIIPGLLAFFMVLLVKEQHAVVTAKLRIDVSLLQFPKGYWHYLLVTALFGLGNSTNSFLILRTQDIGASLEMTILIYAAFNLVAALISYPAGSLSDKWGQKKRTARLVHHLPGRLFRLCPDAKHRSDRRVVCLLRIVSGDIPRCRQSVRIGFCAGTSTRQRRGMVQHHRRPVATGSEHRCRIAVGSDRPCGRILLRCGFCRRRQHRAAPVDSGKTR
jgi:MFS family permease